MTRLIKAILIIILFSLNNPVQSQSKTERLKLLFEAATKDIDNRKYEEAYKKSNKIVELSDEDFDNSAGYLRAKIKSKLQESLKNKNSINWVSLEEAFELNKKNPKQILVLFDLENYQSELAVPYLFYQHAFQNRDVIRYVNEKFYAVKLEKSKHKKVVYKGDTYTVEELAVGFRISSYPSRVYFNENSEYFLKRSGITFFEDLEKELKLIGDKIYKEITSQEDYNEYEKNAKLTFKKYPTEYDYLKTLNTKEGYIDFIENQPRITISEINKRKLDKGLNPVQSKCNAIYDKTSQKLINKEKCSAKLWLKNTPPLNKQYSAYEFDLNFSLTPEFKNSDSEWPLQIMLSNSPKGYIWLAADTSGKFHLSYKTDAGFKDILTVFNADKIHFDKPNHIRFIWLGGYYYIEMNSYKEWSFDLEEDSHKTIPALGTSNRIVFYSDIAIESMQLNTFKQ